MTGIPDDVLERAVEAAAKADYEVLYSNPDRRNPWDEQPDDFRDVFRSDVRLLVTAALVEVEASITAERDELRRWKEEALPVLAGLQNLGRSLDVPLGQCVTGDLAAQRADDLRAEVEALRATVARVEALHAGNSTRPTSDHYYCEPYECDEAGEGELRAYCTACRRFAPCDTAKALRGDES